MYWSVSKLTAGCATHHAHCQASDRWLHSPLGKPQTLQNQENQMPLTWATKLRSKHNSIERRHITAVNTARTISETSSNASSRLMLQAQSSLPQCSREFRNVITPWRKILNVITRQDDCHKLTFMRKDDQYFVTLNDRPWQ